MGEIYQVRQGFVRYIFACTGSATRPLTGMCRQGDLALFSHVVWSVHMKFLAIAAALLSLGASAPAFAAVDLTLFSWENQHHDFRIGQSATGEFITVQNTDPLGVTDGSYSAEVATTATTNFYRGAW